MPTIPNQRMHAQNITTTCGPASAMMVLAAAGTSLAGQRQDKWRDISKQKPCNLDPGTWYSSPGGLVDLLRTKAVVAEQERFVLLALPSKEAMTAYLCETIVDAAANPGTCQAPIALIRGRNHWAVVTGFRADGNEVAGFVVLDPGRFRDLGDKLIPHDAHDQCGAGVVENPDGSSTDWGTPHHIICACEWRQRQMTGIPDPSVCPPPTVFVAIGTAPAAVPDACTRWNPGGPGGWHLRPCSPPGEPGFDPVARAQAQLAAFPFEAGGPHHTDQVWLDVLSGPAIPGPPVKVDFGAGSTFRYWLVPYNLPGRVPLAIMLDPTTGDLLEMWAAAEGTVSLPDVFRFDRIRGRSEFPLTDDRRQTVRVDPTSLNADEVPLVWAPVVESPSPLLPFAVTVALDEAGNRIDQTVYVRLDGVAFERLTPLDEVPELDLDQDLDEETEGEAAAE